MIAGITDVAAVIEPDAGCSNQCHHHPESRLGSSYQILNVGRTNIDDKYNVVVIQITTTIQIFKPKQEIRTIRHRESYHVLQSIRICAFQTIPVL